MCGLFIYLEPKEKEIHIEVSLVEMSESDFEKKDAPKILSLPAATRAPLPRPQAYEELPEAPALEKIEEREPEIKIESESEEITLPEMDTPVFEAPEEAKVVSQKAELKSALRPKYPRSARKRGEEGAVQIAVEVDERGKIIAAEVAVSSGFSDLDKSALSAVESAEFAPIAGKALLRIEFRLQNN